MQIQFVDLQRQYTTLADEMRGAIDGIVTRAAFVGGQAVADFERDFAAYCEAAQCVGVANGTDALELALLALEIGPGDEVITVPNTFIASAAAISRVGARPVFVDVDRQTQQLDPALLPAAITARTRAIIPVHLFGHPADLDPIIAIARAHNLHVVEDAAQAHGARYHGRRVGALADVGCFSFYPGKNLGAYGDGGAVVTNSLELAARIRQLADHGRVDKYRHAVVGRNSRLDGLQAAVLSVKLRHLDDWNDARRRIATALTERLGSDTVVPPHVAPNVEPSFHLYVIQTERREAVQRMLTDAGIASGVHYPIPLHLQPAYAALGYKEGDFPVTELLAGQILSLPIFPELREDEIARICDVVGRATAASLV